jgi:uncharacterized protein (DUF362 family)
MRIERRSFVAGTLGVAARVTRTTLLEQPKYHVVRKRQRSRVAILRAESYTQDLSDILRRGLDLFHLDVRGKTVLLKPNLVDYIPGNHINTHPLLVSATIECFRELGAAEVIVGEGPGHQRDTELVLSESGMKEALHQQRVRFVDLNRDELVQTSLLATYTDLKHLWLPRAVLASHFIVSMPKVKTHHWSGVSLSLKNMFGVVPGAKYGWPKNVLHWKGIDRSILDICATVPVHFVIADGIVAMEGNGPLNGSPRVLHRIVLADDTVAADATCARLMGLDPDKVAHILAGAQFLGNSSVALIDQVGERFCAPATPFQVVPELEHLRLANSPQRKLLSGDMA